jgi:hypothetical protein
VVLLEADVRDSVRVVGTTGGWELITARYPATREQSRGRKRVVLTGEGVLLQTGQPCLADLQRFTRTSASRPVPLSTQYPVLALAEPVTDLVKCLPLPMPIFEGLNLT